MEPYAFLPHRYPFLMLDTFEIVEAGKKAKGKKRITINDPSVLPDGTFPDFLIVEAMAQISGISTGWKSSSMLAGLNEISFFRSVSAGETLEVESSVLRKLGNLIFFECSASVAGEPVAGGGIILHFYEASQPPVSFKKGSFSQ